MSSSSRLHTEISKGLTPLRWIVGPQIVLIAAWLATKGYPLFLATTGLTSFWELFSTAVDMGVGWPLLMLTTFTGSLVLNHVRLSKEANADCGARAYERYSASEQEQFWGVWSRQARALLALAVFLLALMVLVAGGSLVGGAGPAGSITDEREFYPSVVLGAMVAFLVFGAILFGRDEAAVFRSSPGWTRPASAATFEALIAPQELAGHVDTPSSQALVAKTRAWALNREKNNNKSTQALD